MSIGTIATSLVTGVLTARMLQSEGRGEVAAISAWLVSLSWASSLGFADAMVYFQSKRAAPTATIVMTTLLSVPVLGVLGIALAQLVVPLSFSAQTATTQNTARTFLCAVPIVLGFNCAWALLVGQQRFRALNAARLAQPLVYAVGLLVLVVADRFTVTTVLSSQVISYAVVMLCSARSSGTYCRGPRSSLGDFVADCTALWVAPAGRRPRPARYGAS